jgi:hypothetical protein
MTEAELSKRQGDLHLCPDCRHHRVCPVPKALAEIGPQWYLSISNCAHHLPSEERKVSPEEVIK